MFHTSDGEKKKMMEDDDNFSEICMSITFINKFLKMSLYSYERCVLNLSQKGLTTV